MLRPLALLKGYMFLGVLVETCFLITHPRELSKEIQDRSHLCGGFQRGTGVPLCVVAGVGFIGEGPHRKGPAPMACFWLLFARAKSDSGYGAESPEIPRVRAEKAREPSNRIAAILGKEMFLSLPPGDGRI